MSKQQHTDDFAAFRAARLSTSTVTDSTFEAAKNRKASTLELRADGLSFSGRLTSRQTQVRRERATL